MEHQNPLIQDFFADEAPAAQTKTNRIVGGIGLWILHLIKGALLCYTAYHGIHAASLYATDNISLAFQVLGFIVVDLTMLGIYVAYLNKSLAGKSEQLAAAIVYTICLAIAGAAVVIDSQIAIAGVESLTGWSRSYFNFVLPFAPLVAGVGAAVIHVVDEDNRAEQHQHQRHRENERQLADAQHSAQIQSALAELQKQKAVKNMQLGSQLYVAQQLNELVKQPAMLRVLHQQAARDLPALLQAVGIESGSFMLNAGQQHSDDIADLLQRAVEAQQRTEPVNIVEPVGEQAARFHTQHTTTPVSLTAEDNADATTT